MDTNEESTTAGLPSDAVAAEPRTTQAIDGDDERIEIRDDDGDEADTGKDASPVDGADIAPDDAVDADASTDADEDVTEISGEAMGVIEVAGETGQDGEFPDECPSRRRFLARRPLVAAASLASACLLVALGAGLAAGGKSPVADGGTPRQETGSQQASETMCETRSGADSWQSEEVAERLLDERMRLTEAQRSVLSSANSTSAAGPSMCLAWVNDVFDDAGCGFERLWAASEACQLWCDSTDEEDLEPGMIVAVESTDTSPVAGHIGIYIGGGKVRNNETWGGQGIVRTRRLDEWLEMFGKVAKPRWGWAGGRDLSIRAKGEEKGDAAKDKPTDKTGDETGDETGDAKGGATGTSDAQGTKKDDGAARQK